MDAAVHGTDARTLHLPRERRVSRARCLVGARFRGAWLLDGGLRVCVHQSRELDSERAGRRPEAVLSHRPLGVFRPAIRPN